MSEADLYQALSGTTLAPARLVSACVEAGLVQESAGYYVLGPHAPRPIAQAW